jgi:hypothetical protein
LGLNIKLDLGAVVESVTVTGEASLLQTESASRSALIQNRAIEDIPTNGRNLYQLQYTLPGVVKTSRYWGSMELYAFGNVNGVMISGGRQSENETLVDGQSNTKGDRGVAWVPSLNLMEDRHPDQHVRYRFGQRVCQLPVGLSKQRERAAEHRPSLPRALLCAVPPGRLQAQPEADLEPGAALGLLDA